MKELEAEIEDAMATAEAANLGKSAVEKNWTERLVKVTFSLMTAAVKADTCTAYACLHGGAHARCVAIGCSCISMHQSPAPSSGCDDDAPNRLQTEQSWAGKLKKSEADRDQLLAEKEEQWQNELNASQGDAGNALEQLRAEHAAELQEAGESHAQQIEAIRV